MAVRKQKPESPAIPAAYGEELTAAARSLGLSDRELSRAAGYVGGRKDLTMWRLRRGEGTVKSALAIREVLISRGATVPPVPLPDGGDGEAWREEWIVLGQRLHALASATQFAKVVQDVSATVAALETLAGGIRAISHPVPTVRLRHNRGGD